MSHFQLLLLALICFAFSCRGLANASGQNNCFLNVVVQSLWHLDAFREQFCQAENFFSRVIESEEKENEPDSQEAHSECIRKALASVFQGVAFFILSFNQKFRHALCNLFFLLIIKTRVQITPSHFTLQFYLIKLPLSSANLCSQSRTY